VLPLVGVLALAGATAFAQEPEPSDLSKFFGYLGLIELPQDPIEYRERAPLVVPPSVALVPPQQQNITQINPDFPVDHDERQRRARRTDPKEQTRQDDIFFTGKKLGIDEMTRKAKKDPKAGTATGVDDTFHDPQKSRMNPTQLGFTGWNVKDKSNEVVFAGEPERNNLTEPPPGYRTPSPNAPYGVISKKQEKYVAKGYMDKAVDGDTYNRK
jgi:hypothetical protein